MRQNKTSFRYDVLSVLVVGLFCCKIAGAASMCHGVFAAPQVQSAASPLFQSSKPAQLEIEANFTEISKISKRISFLNSENKNDLKFLTTARLTDLEAPGRSVVAAIRPRGNTSLQKGEATFPKLRVEINDTEELKGLIFKGARNFRINTHVATQSKKRTDPYGAFK